MSLEQAATDLTAALKAHSALLERLLSRTDISAVSTQPDTPPSGKPDTKKSSETPKSEPASSTSPASSTKSDTKPESSAPPAAISYDDVKNIVLDVSKKSRSTPQESREQAEALLQRFGVQKISQLGEAVYSEVHGLATRILAGECDATAAESLE